MARDHYIPQCLTRPWHDRRIGKESLRFFDFDTNEFDHRNSGKLFARHGVNKPETERFLGKYIDEPFGIMQNRMRFHADDFAIMTSEIEAMPKTALAGIFYFQMQRIRDHRHDRGANHADDLAVKGYGWLEEFTAAVFQHDDAIIYRVANPMHFPDTGTFSVPLVDHMPAFVLPIDLRVALAFVDRDMDRTQLDTCMADPEFPATCSVGLENVVRRVVIPPEFDDSTAESIIMERLLVTRLFRSVSERSIAAGKNPWYLTPPH